MKYKVIIVIDSLGAGGTQTQVIEYLKHADRSAFDITLVNLDADYITLGDEVQKLGCRIIGIKHRGFFNLRTLIQLRRVFLEEKPDIVETFLFTSDFYGRIAAIGARVPVIISSVRGKDLVFKWYYAFADWLLSKFTKKIVVNAEVLKKHLVEKERIDPRKITTIYNGIDLNKFVYRPSSIDHRRELGIKDGSLIVGMVARLSPQKDYRTLLSAAKLIAKDFPGVYFVCVGYGPLENALKQKAIELGLAEKVVFTGLRRDVPELIHAMDVCVLSSPHEGCPNVILEYMACSKPVVASDVGGCKELVVEGETGFIVPPADALALADKLMKLLKDPALRTRMGSAGYKRAEENFTSDVMARKTEALFIELLNKKS